MNLLVELLHELCLLALQFRGGQKWALPVPFSC